MCIINAENQLGAMGIPKWEPKLYAETYLSYSAHHAGSVSLVLNLKTGMVSLQFHVVYEDEFMTVLYLCSADLPPN